MADAVSCKGGAPIEWLSVASVDIRRCSWNLGDPVLVTGLSPIGSVTLLFTGAAGAEPLVITELSGTCLNFANKSFALHSNSPD